MIKEEELRLQVKSRFIDLLRKERFPYWPPALTVCPHCGEHAEIIDSAFWICDSCGQSGDVVDFVRAYEHLESDIAAIKRVCRTLRIKFTVIDAVSADELLDKQIESVPPLIENLIGRGVILAAGAPKIGKSWLSLWLAHQVSRGEAVWGFKTRKEEVLYISLEDTRERLQARLAKISGGETGNIWFATETELIGNGFEEQLVGFLDEHPAVKFVIVDTLQKIRQLGGDQFNYAGDYEVISRLKSLADRFGITILLIHHTRKAPASDPFATISGTTGLSGGADGSLVLVKNLRGDGQAKLFVTGRDVADQEIDLLFDKETCTWEILGFSKDMRIEKREHLLEALNEFLREAGSFHGTATELLEKLTAKAELQVKSPNALTRLLNPQKTFLQHEYGISYSVERSGKERTLHLTRVETDKIDDGIAPQ